MKRVSEAWYAVEAISVLSDVNAFAKRPTSLRVVGIKDFQGAIVGCQGVKDLAGRRGSVAAGHRLERSSWQELRSLVDPHGIDR